MPFLFSGIEKIVEARTGKSTLGFGGNVVDKSKLDMSKVYAKVIPQDLVKFGLIPELVGRVPVITALNELDENALINILSEPKNALLKQYKALFSMDDVVLEFSDDALKAVAQLTLEKKTGARGLRAIMEKALLPVMYEIPSDSTITKVVITKECVTNGDSPIIERINGEKISGKTEKTPKTAG